MSLYELDENSHTDTTYSVCGGAIEVILSYRSPYTADYTYYTDCEYTLVKECMG